MSPKSMVNPRTYYELSPAVDGPLMRLLVLAKALQEADVELWQYTSDESRQRRLRKLLSTTRSVRNAMFAAEPKVALALLDAIEVALLGDAGDSEFKSALQRKVAEVRKMILFSLGQRT